MESHNCLNAGDCEDAPEIKEGKFLSSVSLESSLAAAGVKDDNTRAIQIAGKTSEFFTMKQ